MNHSYRRYNVYQPSRQRNTSSRPSKPARRLSRKLQYFLAALILIAGLGLYIDHSHKAAAREAALAAELARQEKQKKFADDVRLLIAENERIDISVSAIDLKSGTVQNIGLKSPMIAASTGKLLTACLYLDRVEKGKQEMNAPVSWFSGRDGLWQLINRSNNIVWEELNDRFGDASLTAYAKKIGMKNYDVEQNMLTTQDMATLLHKLYTNELLNRKNTDYLLSLMQKTNYEDFMSPAVPKNLKFYHKVGVLDDRVNDAAIISDSSNGVALVVFTNGNGIYNWDTRAEIIQEITRLAVSAYL